MEQEGKIPAAIIGLGRIASLLEDDELREKPCTHAGAIVANAGCVLAGGCDHDGERRRLFARRWQTPVYDDAGDMIADIRPEILVIATHPDSHAHYCGLAAERRVPVVICEKPLADTLARSRRIAALEKTGMRIIINHERRYSENYIRAGEILASGRLGKTLSVRGRLYMGRNRRLLDQLWHDGTHLADAVMFLVGGILKHRGSWGAGLKSKDGTAWLEGFLEQEAGQGREKQRIPVLFELGAGRDHLVFDIEFSAERGMQRIGYDGDEALESAESPYAVGFRSLRDTGERFEGKTSYFANMVSDAAACARNPGLRPRSSASDGLRVIEYLNSIKRWK
jgi:predicted dehydrogenase